MRSLQRSLANWLFPSERSTIEDSKGGNVTVTSTHSGGISLDGKELYRSRTVQEFIKNVEPECTKMPTK